MRVNKPKTWLQHFFYWPLLLLAVVFFYYGFEVLCHYFFRKSVTDTLNNTIGTLIASNLFIWFFLTIAFAIVRPKKIQIARTKKVHSGLFLKFVSFINKPKTLIQHVFYWPFLWLAVFFIYLDFELIYNYLFRQRSDDTFVYTGVMLILVSLFVWGFIAIASAIVRPEKAAKTLYKEKELIKKKEQGVFYGVQFIISANSLKLGEKFSVQLKGLNNQFLRKKPLALWFYCIESIGYASGAVGGYTVNNHVHIQKHELTLNDRSGGKLDFMIPADNPPTYIELSGFTAEWFFRVEFVERKLDVCNIEDGITSQELNVLPKLAEDTLFKIPKSKLQKISREEIWIELDGEPEGINQCLIVEVGKKISGRLVILDKKQRTSTKKLSIELCFFLANDVDYSTDTKYHIQVPSLAIGERFEHSFEFTIPEKGPISVAGGIFEISWSIRSRTLFEWLFGIEPVVSSPFDVVPKGFVQKINDDE